MLYNKDKFVAMYKKVVEQTKQKPSSGVVCAIATLLVIRDGMVENLGGDNGKAKDECAAIRGEINELVKQLTGKDAPELAGFACNASAAAKAAGYKGETQAGIEGLGDLIG